MKTDLDRLDEALDMLERYPHRMKVDDGNFEREVRKLRIRVHRARLVNAGTSRVLQLNRSFDDLAERMIG